MSSENHRRNPGMATMQGGGCNAGEMACFFVVEAILMKIEGVECPPRLQIKLPVFSIFSRAGS